MVGGCGGSEAAAAAMSPAAGGRKRVRGPEEDVYVDNLHSHKRYLSEMMASSMNGLSVGDSVADSTMGSPVRLENDSCFRDEMLTQCSSMSEESDDYRSYEAQVDTNWNQADLMNTPSTSPISRPHRFQKPHTWSSSAYPYPLRGCSLSAGFCSNARSGTEQEGRIPSSPNDMCHGGDLRRTALLRSVQMRVQNPHPSDSLFVVGHEQEQEDRQLRGVELDRRSFLSKTDPRW